MKRILNRKNTPSVKRESVEDPHELLLSLVDLGSLDAEDALLACVQEMSDAECKRVLGSLSLPNCCDEDPMDDDDDISADLVPLDDADDAFAEDEAPAEDEEPDDEEAEAVEERNNRELEAKVRRLEKIAFGESRRSTFKKK